MTETPKTESGALLTAEQAKDRAAALYRLAFLMTGDRVRSLDATLEAVDSGDGTGSFFSGWLLAWSRRLIIAKVLAGVRDELAASARRTASLRNKQSARLLPARDFDLDANRAAGQLERALLAIDLFPRCALLLTVFEEISVDDAAILLDADRDLVRKARILGLRELARILTGARGGACRSGHPCIGTKERRMPNLWPSAFGAPGLTGEV